MSNNVVQLATVFSFHENFNKDNISILQEMGFDVHLIANESTSNYSETRKKVFYEYCKLKNITLHHLEIPRSPFRLISLGKSYYQLLSLLRKLDVKLVHSHTPVGGVLGRLVSRKLSITNLYTAHGFHFYKGAPILYWAIYYPIERLLGRFSDAIITINIEDYKRSLKKLNKNTYYVPGVGIHVEQFQFDHRNSLMDEMTLVSIGELTKNKNHRFVLRSLSHLNEQFQYNIAGTGLEINRIRSLVSKLHLNGRVRLLGYVDDVKSIFSSADVFVMPSLREGLPVSLIEAMAAGLPILGSNVRGIRELVDHGKGGFLYPSNNQDAFLDFLRQMSSNPSLRKQMGYYNKSKAKNYDIAIVREAMKDIYLQYLPDKQNMR